ncbi:Pycsar system effector family protein [Isoptericola sp. NPDC057391]|uniref:Pycsar system effector family protein n=1 Tax=Isoptericola sp. NPDC057391 TaxID=3346117 RepID=UPI003625AEBD
MSPQSPNVDPTSSEAAAVETAWRIHDKTAGATGAVDSKAAFLFTVQSAALVVVVTLSDQGRVLSRTGTPWENMLLLAGMLLLLIGALLSATIVVPRLRFRAVRRRADEWKTNTVYFGHLRHWDPPELEAALRDKPVLPMLAEQLVHMSKIAWRKHVAAIVSLWVTLAGLASVAWCTALVLY